VYTPTHTWGSSTGRHHSRIVRAAFSVVRTGAVSDRSSTYMWRCRVGRYEQLPLKVETGDLPKATRRKFPHLAELPLLRLSAEAAEKAPAILRTQCVLVAERDGIPQAATGAMALLQRYELPSGEANVCK
jgi:hypothetical protein